MKKIDKINRPIGVSLDDGMKEYLIQKPYDPSREFPTPKQVFIQEAIKKLTKKQRKIWEYHAYDRLTQDEISIRMNISQPVVAKHIKACERRIMKYCHVNMGVYRLIKSEME